VILLQAVQFFKHLHRSDYILGAVGILQFEVTMARLKAEYGVDAIYEPVNYSVARWISCEDKVIFNDFKNKFSADIAKDSEGFLTFLTTSEWQLKFAVEQWPDVNFFKTREHA